MKHIIYLLFICLVFLSCHREGQVGELVLLVNPKHHSTEIKGATIYVRFGAKDLPGTSPSDYDLEIRGDSLESFVKIERLQRGDYFIYGIGYDSTISQAVSGGAHVKLKGKTGETSIDLAITE